MFSKSFVLNEQSIAAIEQLGELMPGGFFICKADGSEELLYANNTVCDIFGCDSLEDFKELTDFSFPKTPRTSRTRALPTFACWWQTAIPFAASRRAKC